MAERLRDEGYDRPELAAAVLEARAELALDQAGFARFLGVDLRAVEALEAGQPAPAAVVRALARRCPDVDWQLLSPLPAERGP